MDRRTTRHFEVTGAGGARLAAGDYAAAAIADTAADSGAGARPGVLLLHGLLRRAPHWAVARRLAPRCRAPAPDRRGHGRSERLEGLYSAEAYLADAAAVEQLGLAPVTVIGRCEGVLAAWQLAAHRSRSRRRGRYLRPA